MFDMDKGQRWESCRKYYLAGWQFCITLLLRNLDLVPLPQQIRPPIGKVQRKLLILCDQDAQRENLLGLVIKQPGVILRTGGERAQAADVDIDDIAMILTALVVAK